MATHNIGYITASTCEPLMAKKGLGEGSKTFARQIALERSGLVDPEVIKEANPQNDHMEWGNTYEPYAVEAYEEENFVDVYNKNENQESVKSGWLSCTPDGLINDDGLLEVKCPSSLLGAGGHLRNITEPEKFRNQYYNQVQMQLYMTGREWVDLTSYDPRFEEKNLMSVRITPDKSWQKTFTERVEEFEKMVSEILRKLK